MENFGRQFVDTSKLPQQVVEKWSASALAEGFVPFPKKLLRCLGQLFPGSDPVKELAVLLAAVDFKRPNQTRRPSLAFLAFLAGLEPADFEIALRRLESKGFIQVDGDAQGLEVSWNKLLDLIERIANHDIKSVGN